MHYTCQDDQGMVFDSSADREPLEFTMGETEVIPAVEEAVVGMSPGEAKTVAVEADRAYGPHRPEMVITVPWGGRPARH